MRRRDEIVASFAQVLFSENETHAQEGVLPRFASPDDAFAIVGAIAELVSRQLRSGEPEHSADLQPVIERFASACSAAPPPRGERRRGRRSRALEREVVACRALPAARRLARARSRREKRAAFADETYWGRPVPGFGDPDARDPRARPRARRPRRQPHRPRLHRRPLGRLAVRARCGAAGWRTSRSRASRDDGLELRGAG